jgi:hypothetical protein
MRNVCDADLFRSSGAGQHHPAEPAEHPAVEQGPRGNSEAGARGGLAVSNADRESAAQVRDRAAQRDLRRPLSRFAKRRSAFRPSRSSSQILAFQPLPRTTGLAAVGSRDPVLVAGRDSFRDSVYIGLSNRRLHLFGDRAADDHVGHPKLLTPRLDICAAYSYQDVVHQVFHT